MGRWFFFPKGTAVRIGRCEEGTAAFANPTGVGMRGLRRSRQRLDAGPREGCPDALCVATRLANGPAIGTPLLVWKPSADIGGFDARRRECFADWHALCGMGVELP